MHALSLILVIVGCSALLLVVVIVSVRFMAALFRRRSGYARLASRYPGDAGSRDDGLVTEGDDDLANDRVDGVASDPGNGAAIDLRDSAVSVDRDRRLYRQTAQFGAVRYTRCVTVGILSDGLFLQVVSRALGTHRPIVVPWTEIGATCPATIRAREAVELMVGSPPVAGVSVLPGVYAEFRSRLAGAAPLV